ncbi:MAG: DUF58 domain-containing protein [Chloroflexota bacterium]
MLTPEMVRKIRQIEIHTRRLVNDSFAGEYQAVFKGRGMEFDEVRPYTPGDDVRTIDWNVTARSGEPYVKRYAEERELTVMLLVDASASGDFGSVKQFKRELAAELTAVLAFSATTNNDKVGLLIFTDRIELYIPPRKGRKHVLRLIRELLAFVPQGRGTDIRLALETVNHALKRRSILFLVSDFLADAAGYGRILGVTNRRHDVVAIDLNDPLEQEFAAVGLVALEDAETGAFTWVDTNSQAWQAAFRQRSEQIRQAKRDIFNRARVDRIRVTTSTDYVTALTQFFQKRARRLGR